MAVRKFLDDSGAALLNTILANKFATKRNISDGDIIKELTSPIRIWDLEDGLYILPGSCTIYYNGETSTSTATTLQSKALIFISHDGSYKQWICFGNVTNTNKLIFGYTTSASGTYYSRNMSSLLTSISSYVKNNLTYSTSGTTYALSAYQGYLLDQNKADKTEIPTKTSDLTNDSNFVEDNLYVHTDNNFSTALKNKLDAIASGAEVNAIDTIKVNGTSQTITNKAVDISVPTKTSDLINDSGYGDVSTKQNQVTYSTTDITPGTTTLTTGDIYIVYE